MRVGETGEEEAPSRVADFGGPRRVGLREKPCGVGPQEGSRWRANAAPRRVTYVCGAGQDHAPSLPRVQSYSSVFFPFHGSRSKESLGVSGRLKVGEEWEGGFRAGRKGGRTGACFSISASGALALMVARGSRVHRCSLA